MSPEEIIDAKSLEAWLESRPEACMVIAARLVLRVLPFHISTAAELPTLSADRSPLLALRSVMSAVVALRFPEPRFKHLAFSSAFSRSSYYDVEQNSLSRAAFAAVLAHDLSVAAGQETLSVAAVQSGRLVLYAVGAFIHFGDSCVAVDASLFEARRDLFHIPLWPSLPSDTTRVAEIAARSLWAHDPGTWSFWLRWWDGILSGNQLDWALQKQVALIPDDTWEQGPAAVAEAIRQIELDFAIARTPNAEEVKRDEQGLFYTLPISTIRPDLFRAAMEKVQDDIVEIRAAPRMANCLPFFADDLRRLGDHFARYSDQPLRIHDVYLKTLRHIEALQRQGLLPDDTLIEDLRQDLDTGAVDIRRSDSEVTKTVKARIGDRLARLKADKRAEAEAAVNGAAAESRDDLKEELKQDLATVSDPKAEPEDRDESSHRLLSRLLRMGKKRKDDMVKTADDIGKVSRGAEGLSKGAEAAQSWWEWVITNLPGMGG